MIEVKRKALRAAAGLEELAEIHLVDGVAAGNDGVTGETAGLIFRHGHNLAEGRLDERYRIRREGLGAVEGDLT